MTQPQLYCLLGRALSVGDYFVTSAATGNGMGLAFGEIVSFLPENKAGEFGVRYLSVLNWYGQGRYVIGAPCRTSHTRKMKNIIRINEEDLPRKVTELFKEIHKERV